MKAHPIAELFPMMNDAELRELGENIKANGLREPIVVDGFEWEKAHPKPLRGRLKGREWRLAYEKAIDDGDILIIDGRNRYTAAKLAGLPWMGSSDGSSHDITYREFGDNIVGPYEDRDDIAGFIISKNVHRRHLTESQRAIIAARIATLRKGDNQHTETSAPSQAQAAEKLQVSTDSVQFARKVIDKGAPELVAAVVTGAASVSAAACVAEKPIDEQREIVARGEKEILAVAKEIRKAKTAKKTPKSRPQVEIVESDEPYEGEDDNFGKDADAEPADLRMAYLIRADQAARFAVYVGPVDDEVIGVAEHVANAWLELVKKLKPVEPPRPAEQTCLHKDCTAPVTYTGEPSHKRQACHCPAHWKPRGRRTKDKDLAADISDIMNNALARARAV